VDFCSIIITNSSIKAKKKKYSVKILTNLNIVFSNLKFMHSFLRNREQTIQTKKIVKRKTNFKSALQMWENWLRCTWRPNKQTSVSNGHFRLPGIVHPCCWDKVSFPNNIWTEKANLSSGTLNPGKRLFINSQYR
jgi:hypothetical protein